MNFLHASNVFTNSSFDQYFPIRNSIAWNEVNKNIILPIGIEREMHGNSIGRVVALLVLDYFKTQMYIIIYYFCFYKSNVTKKKIDTSMNIFYYFTLRSKFTAFEMKKMFCHVFTYKAAYKIINAIKYF